MRCKDIMKRVVECASPDDTVKQAAKQMRDRNIGFLPVCDDSQRVIGTVTDRDLALRVIADGRELETAVREIMSKEVVSCDPDDPLSTAEDLMSKNHKSRIVCADRLGKLVGVISLSDIAQHVWALRAGRTLRKISAREARI